jgi:hypothetical protein
MPLRSIKARFPRFWLDSIQKESKPEIRLTYSVLRKTSTNATTLSMAPYLASLIVVGIFGLWNGFEGLGRDRQLAFISQLLRYHLAFNF